MEVRILFPREGPIFDAAEVTRIAKNKDERAGAWLVACVLHILSISCFIPGRTEV